MTQLLTLAPFTAGNADAICDALAGALETNSDRRHPAYDAFWSGRSMVLLRALVPALVWMRDARGVPITPDSIRAAVGFQAIVGLAVRKVFPLYVDEDDDPVGMPVTDIPDALLEPLRSYLGETPGFDMARASGHEVVDVPARQHACVIAQLRSLFAQPTTGRRLHRVYSPYWPSV